MITTCINFSSIIKQLFRKLQIIDIRPDKTTDRRETASHLPTALNLLLLLLWD